MGPMGLPHRSKERRGLCRLPTAGERGIPEKKKPRLGRCEHFLRRGITPKRAATTLPQPSAIRGAAKRDQTVKVQFDTGPNRRAETHRSETANERRNEGYLVSLTQRFEFALFARKASLRETLPEFGAPGRTRTCDHRLRRPMLYPTELLARSAEPRESEPPESGRGERI